MTVAFTSITMSYLPNARILARSVKETHPEWRFILLLNDIPPESVNWATEPFDEVFYAHWLPIPNFRQWAFGYNVVELCTATKGPMALHIVERYGPDAVVYLDPDTVVFSRLEEMCELLRDHDVILTPHLTDPEVEIEQIESHEIAALKHGTFNLGFFAVANRPRGRAFLEWWAKRLLAYAHIDFNRGLFTDQKWCNLVPYIFPGVHVLVDRAYNVATWNMARRQIGRDVDGRWLVNGRQVRFYHFSGFGNDFAWADLELRRFAAELPYLRELWNHYKDLYRESSAGVDPSPWYWGHFANGAPITYTDRERYKGDDALRAEFPDPYSDACFINLRR